MTRIRLRTTFVIAIAFAVLLGVLGLSKSLGSTEYPPIDNIPCQSHYNVRVHFHVHLDIYVGGKRVIIPGGIGIHGDKNYWIHTHADSGVIHIEAPVMRKYTLGQFFDIWGQPLNQTTLGTFQSAAGIRVYINGKLKEVNPYDIVLRNHELVTLEIGTFVPPTTNYVFPDEG